MNETDVKELANVIYHEARGESRQGQIAVGRVVLNRVNSGKYPSSVKAVVWQRGQFSGIRYHAGWRKFEALARELLAGGHRSVGTGWLFFANVRVARRGVRIGQHRFW